MDFSGLTLLLMLIASAIGLDAAMHPTSVVLDASVPSKLDKLAVDADALNAMLAYEVNEIASTPSILAPPEIRTGLNKGVGMALAESVNMQSVALALQAQLGYRPEQLRLTLLGDGGAVTALITGSGLGGRIRTPPFQDQIILQPGESLTDFVRRAALIGMARIDPYVTALYLVQVHADDRDFGEAEKLINDTKRQLPRTPVSFDRSVLENLQGIIALFRGQLDEASTWFHTASQTDPGDFAARLNSIFVDVHLGRFAEASKHAEALLANHPPTDKVLLATAYMSWGAALLGLNELDAADAKLARAVEIDPASADAHDLWSEIKQMKGDTAMAEQLRKRAWEVTDLFENYAEIAALYFRLAWKPGQKLERSPFVNPQRIRFN